MKNVAISKDSSSADTMKYSNWADSLLFMHARELKMGLNKKACTFKSILVSTSSRVSN